MKLACASCGTRYPKWIDRRCMCGGAVLIVSDGWVPTLAEDRASELACQDAIDRFRKKFGPVDCGL